MVKQRLTRTEILDAALALLREEGESALTARAVARQANCSVQPLYSLFGDMPGLAAALFEHARAWVANYNREHVAGSNPFASNGRAHLALARDEKHLFHFLYLSPHMQVDSFEELYRSVSMDGVEEFIQKRSGLSVDKAHELYLNMIIYTHGIASLIAVDAAEFGDEELEIRMDAAFRAFYESEGR